MRMIADTEMQARLMREIMAMYERRETLEANIRAVDRDTKLRIEKEALRDIEAYRALQVRRQQSL